MADNVEYLPLWKKDATPEERLLELAMIARKHPERFDKIVVLYVEKKPDNHTLLRQASLNVTVHEMVGIMAEAAHSLYER